MKPLFLSFQVALDPETKTWCAIGKDRQRKIFGVGSGPTRQTAETALREAVVDSLAADAADGVDGTPALFKRPPKQTHLVFTALDLLPLGLRRARAELNLRQSDLADRLGITQQAYAKLERPGANPTLQTLIQWEEALDRELVTIA